MTRKLVNAILRTMNDKETCQNEKSSCHGNAKDYGMTGRIERKGADGMPLYNHLKEYRARLGVNQQQMGMLCGTSRQTISQIERGDYSPSVSLALKIAKVCDAKVEDIFEYEEEES